MDDERTKQWMIDAAQKKCTCASCMKAREEKALKVSQELPSKIVKPMPGNYIPELSSNNKIWDIGRRLRSRGDSSEVS